MLISVHAQPGAADAVRLVLDRPGVAARHGRTMAGGEMLAGVIAAAIPFTPPRRPVAVLFLRVDRLGQPVIDIRIPPLAQDDPAPAQRRQRQQHQPVRHHTPTLRRQAAGGHTRRARAARVPQTVQTKHLDPGSRAWAGPRFPQTRI